MRSRDDRGVETSGRGGVYGDDDGDAYADAYGLPVVERYALELVRCALALHLDIDALAIQESDVLDADLGLDLLDLVLIVLRLEELGDIEFPLADLEGIRTVGDLADLVRNWSTGYVRSARATTIPPPPRLDSGVHVIGSVVEEAPSSRRAAG